MRNCLVLRLNSSKLMNTRRLDKHVRRFWLNAAERPRLAGGIILTDKPSGVSSKTHSQGVVLKALEDPQYELVLSRLKMKNRGKLSRHWKVGHLGTLDPMASGVLPIAFGSGTGLIRVLTHEPKVYTAKLLLGQATDTEDQEGKIVKEMPVPDLISQEELDRVALKFTGEIDQQPSIFSAVKVKGNCAYKLARKGVDFQMPSRKVNITGLSLSLFNSNTLSMEVICGSGTYIRSLGRDIALELGTCGHLIELRRTKTGPYFPDKEDTIITTEQVIATFDRMVVDLSFNRVFECIRNHGNLNVIMSRCRGFQTYRPGFYSLYTAAGPNIPHALVEKTTEGPLRLVVYSEIDKIAE